MHKNIFKLILIGWAVAWAQVASAAPLPRITVDANQEIGPVKSMLGFLHGLDHRSFETKNYSPGRLAELKPRFWRIGVNSALSNYKVAKALDPSIKITLVISDVYADGLKGGYRKVRPWEDWSGYEKEIKFIIGKASEAGMRIDYWDVWSEPDHAAYWPGNCDQIFELFKRTYRAIRAVDPNAKIVGPSISNVKNGGTCRPKPFLAQFLDYLAAENLRFDAISWHEFDFPEEIPEHVDAVRRFFKEHPSLGTPEIHINELSGPADHLIPGWAVGWLYYLEKAEVDWASRGCWEVKSGASRWSDCQAGLNGLLLKDNETPQAVYWVYRAYAEMSGRRLKSTLPAARSVAIASRNDQTKEIRVLLGRYDVKERKGAPADLEVEIQNYPYPVGALQVDVQRIPNENIPGPLPGGPAAVSAGGVSIRQGAVIVPLTRFQDGDAYVIILRSKG